MLFGAKKTAQERTINLKEIPEAFRVCSKCGNTILRARLENDTDYFAVGRAMLTKLERSNKYLQVECVKCSHSWFAKLSPPKQTKKSENLS